MFNPNRPFGSLGPSDFGRQLKEITGEVFPDDPRTAAGEVLTSRVPPPAPTITEEERDALQEQVNLINARLEATDRYLRRTQNSKVAADGNNGAIDDLRELDETGSVDEAHD